MTKNQVATQDTDDETELRERLKSHKSSKSSKSSDEEYCGEVPFEEDAADRRAKKETGELQQWATTDNQTYMGIATSVKKLPPGLYEIESDSRGNVYFVNCSHNQESIINFPDGASEKVLNNIKTFWEREDVYRKNGLTFKRGILLWGPPGSGKSSTIKLIMNDVIKRSGIVLKFNHPGIFKAGSRVLRQIEPDVPVVVIMEDLDAILEIFNESDVINILDGVDVINKVVFVATTNYPERLGERVINRPSRFDRRYKIGNPNEECRRIYFEHLFGNSPTHTVEDFDIETWIKDTSDMSLSHLKELFVGVVILGDDYDMVIEKLKNMKQELTSADYNDDAEQGGLGFGYKASESV